MALDDFRTWLDVKAQDGKQGSLALEAKANVDALGLVAIAPDGTVVELTLDYSDAGMLLDQLRAGMGVLLARAGNPVAVAALIGADAARHWGQAASTADTPPLERD